MGSRLCDASKELQTDIPCTCGLSLEEAFDLKPYCNVATGEIWSRCRNRNNNKINPDDCQCGGVHCEEDMICNINGGIGMCMEPDEEARKLDVNESEELSWMFDDSDELEEKQDKK